MSRFFNICCLRAGVEPSHRQWRKFLKGQGSAYHYAIQSGNKKRARDVIREHRPATKLETKRLI
jgi:predicted methyltransferase